MLMGEEVGDQIFRIVEFTIDNKSGSHSHFFRDADQHEQALFDFFEKTEADYARFNYLGEWHTHPSFSVHPSLLDVRSMQKLVDESEGVNFAVLLIARLRWFWEFEAAAQLFVKGYKPSFVELQLER